VYQDSRRGFLTLKAAPSDDNRCDQWIVHTLSIMCDERRRTSKGRPRGGSVTISSFEKMAPPTVPYRGHEAGCPHKITLFLPFSWFGSELYWFMCVSPEQFLRETREIKKISGPGFSLTLKKKPVAQQELAGSPGFPVLSALSESVA
jgi:hypothetical protein